MCGGGENSPISKVARTISKAPLNITILTSKVMQIRLLDRPWGLSPKLLMLWVGPWLSPRDEGSIIAQEIMLFAITLTNYLFLPVNYCGSIKFFCSLFQSFLPNIFTFQKYYWCLMHHLFFPKDKTSVSWGSRLHVDKSVIPLAQYKKPAVLRQEIMSEEYKWALQRPWETLLLLSGESGVIISKHILHVISG